MYFFLIISLQILIFLGLFFYKSWLNPISIFNIVWLIAIFLYGFRLSPNLQAKLTNKTCWLLLLGNVIFSFFCILFGKISIKKNIDYQFERKEITFDQIKKHFWIWLFIEIFETIYSKGFPLIWALHNSGKTYHDYGIPSLHGLANAYGLSVLTILAYQLFSKKYEKQSKIIRTYIAVMLCMYFFMLTRQVIVSAILQLLAVFCFARKKIPFLKLSLIILTVIILFGILGNIRTGYFEFLRVSAINTRISSIFIGFYWVYMYITMTIANLNKIFNLNFTPLGIGYTLSIYLPSIFHNSLSNFAPIDSSIYLVTPAFNVSGYNADSFISMGIWGLVIIAAIYGALGGILYKKISGISSMKNIIYYAIYLQIIILSFFYNQLFYLPSGFQLIIIYLFFKNLRSKNLKKGI